MSLTKLAELVGGEVIGSLAQQVAPVVTADTRNEALAQGGVFVAIPGFREDGHKYLTQAFAKGASCAVVSEAATLAGHPGVLVSDPRRALSRIAAAFSGAPSAKLKLIGITGTSGKTSVNWMLYQLLSRLSAKNAAIDERSLGAFRVGTLGVASNIAKDFDSELDLTTPDAAQVQGILHRAVAQGLAWGVMEVTSVALDQHRVADVDFDCAIFTNLSRDHLDYHGDFEPYFISKRKLFEQLALSAKPSKLGVINVDCDYGKLLALWAAEQDLRLVTFGSGECCNELPCDYRLSRFEQGVAGSTLVIQSRQGEVVINSPYIGHFNGSNVMAAFAALVEMGFSAAEVARCFVGLPAVPGRMELVRDEARDVSAYVDYSHKPDALKKALLTLRELKPSRLTVVFGCGGERDRTKRPIMGQIAEQYADRVVVTSDNPRREDPEAIISEILSSGIRPALVEVDRAVAIRQALESSEPGEVILIAGKGHEDYQILGERKIHFSDREQIEAMFNGKTMEGR